nr:reverse transcriptase domain-containing protein [Tanacetum cinerariifolium]
MPLSVWKNLGLPDLIPTRMTLELANSAICTPDGIVRDVFVPVGMYFLSEEFPDTDSFNDFRSHFDDDPLSGSTTYLVNSLRTEFADELALISYLPDYDDNRACDIESDIREI